MRQLQSDYQEVLRPGFRARILVEIVPPDMMDYLRTKMEDDDAYEDIKELVLRFVESRHGQGRALMGRPPRVLRLPGGQ